MITGDPDTGKFHDNIPLRFADVEAGDMLYNPPWEWHAIQNYPGLSIGVPIREFNASLSFTNNFQYSSIVILNKIFLRLGFHIDTY